MSFLVSALITRDRVASRPKRGPTYRTPVVCAASHQPLLARPPRATQLGWAALLLVVAFFLPLLMTCQLDNSESMVCFILAPRDS